MHEDTMTSIKTVVVDFASFSCFYFIYFEGDESCFSKSVDVSPTSPCIVLMVLLPFVITTEHDEGKILCLISSGFEILITVEN